MKIAFNIHLSTDGAFTGLRYFLLKTARNLRLAGTLGYSTIDNSIHIHVEGEEKNIRKFISSCSSGNSFCKVKHINFNLAEVKNYERFDIITTSPAPRKKPATPRKKPSFRLGLFGL
ncbi:MAG: acylphosphatase [Lentimicrobium sp.]|nr:acylphosphatase [Lentimicrobium sp.]MDD2527009.1 acylphosphatase [Lentimicrobiaceae bacterium]MDD4598790.1 acylphosphatase [Lentimicrobiaceae bacterium]MDY0025023.1 acylphosphatase [Lentimicrobium sp.]